MSRYNKLIKEILDGIFEGYALEDGKLKIVNESAAKGADSALHKLVLEKSRDLWDQLEAAEGSLADVAEEISFEELNADPSSVDMTLHSGGNEPDAPAVDAAAAGETEPTLENLLGSEDFSFDSIFNEVMDIHEPPMADGGPKDEPTMMDAVGDEEEENGPVDGDEDFADLEMGMDDAGMGSADMGDEMNGMDDELNGEPEGDEMGMDLEPEGGEEAFDFDLDLGGEEGMEPEGDEMGLDLEPEGGEEGMELEPEGEEEEAEEGYGSKPYRMEDKGDK